MRRQLHYPAVDIYGRPCRHILRLCLRLCSRHKTGEAGAIIFASAGKQLTVRAMQHFDIRNLNPFQAN